MGMRKKTINLFNPLYSVAYSYRTRPPTIGSLPPNA